jgi:hypothetical protein
VARRPPPKPPDSERKDKAMSQGNDAPLVKKNQSAASSSSSDTTDDEAILFTKLPWAQVQVDEAPVQRILAMGQEGRGPRSPLPRSSPGIDPKKCRRSPGASKGAGKDGSAPESSESE